jgi:uncharacterized protein (DUF2141 family)
MNPLCATTLSGLALALLAAAPLAQASEPAAGCAVLELKGVRPEKGQLLINLFDSAEAYRKKPLVSLRVPAGASEVQQVTACGLGAAAEIAVLMFQDLDGDGKMGQNAFGIPTEPWGSSGSPGAFGPSWDSGRVTLNGSAVVAVQLSK